MLFLGDVIRFFGQLIVLGPPSLESEMKTKDVETGMGPLKRMS